MSFVLGDMAATHPEVVSVLLSWVRGGSSPLRRVAIRALGRSGLGQPAVIRGLAEALAVEDPAAPVTSLRCGLKDGDPPARVAQAAALARVSHDPAALPVLRSALKEPALAGDARAGLEALNTTGPERSTPRNP